jgi:hypothetical protein
VDLVAALVFITQRCRAPVDAFTVLHKKTYKYCVRAKTYTRRTLCQRKD